MHFPDSKAKMQIILGVLEKRSIIFILLLPTHIYNRCSGSVFMSDTCGSFCGGCVVQLVCRNVSLRVTSPHIVRYASRNDQNVPRRRLCWPLQFGQYQVPMSRSRMQKCRNHFFVINSAVYAPIYFKYIPQCFSSSAEFCFPVKTCKIL